MWHVVSLDFYRDRRIACILQLPTDNPFTSDIVGGGEIFYFHVALSVVDEIALMRGYTNRSAGINDQT
jgi:hypothetical protein